MVCSPEFRLEVESITRWPTIMSCFAWGEILNLVISFKVNQSKADPLEEEKFLVDFTSA